MWAAVCARDLTQRRHRLVANALALAAAARCGMRGRAMVLEPHDGRVMIPSLGMLARGGPGRVTAEDLDGPWWWPIRSLTAVHSGRRITVPLDDLDPYRGFHGAPVQSRLTTAQFDAVASRFRDAWRLLVERCPRRAAELAGGLMSITPLTGEDADDVRSATSPEAFGGVATTMPPDGVELAVVMVREFQHSKLSALEALAPLWRGKPVCAVLHKIYALTAVAALWRDLKAAESTRERATWEFAFVRAQLRRTLDGLAPGDPGLTAAGRRLVARIDQTVRSLARVGVPAAVEDHARERLATAT
jgi:HEXXH motif-containing protein